jgi:hypothetical protein
LLSAGANSVVALETWSHLLISIDLNNSANRYVYLNDTDITSSISWSTYNVGDISFTEADWFVASSNAGATQRNEGRQAHTFLDYTYRDLSTTSNRRLFIDANGGSTSPATLSALNPIMYLPMTENYSIGENIGTGGDFTSNGSPTIINRGTEYVAGSGDGGLVWIKNRAADNHALFDTERGTGVSLFPNLANAQSADALTQDLVAFNGDGFGLGANLYASVNGYTENFVSWTFRKAPRFFDVVTYTGDGVAGREIAHNLGCEVGMVIVKSTNDALNWEVWHKVDGVTPKALRLNLTSAASAPGAFNSTAPTDTVFTVAQDWVVNKLNNTYVAYLFAHDPDGLNDDGMIACGSYTGNGAVDGPEIDLGWEPQYLLVKRVDVSGSWEIVDTMRGSAVGGTDALLKPDSSDAEDTGGTGELNITPTGFKIVVDYPHWNSNTEPYIYMAIRAPMMKEPEAGTEVFETVSYSGDTTDRRLIESNFVVDMAFLLCSSGVANNPIIDRLRGQTSVQAATLLLNVYGAEETAQTNRMQAITGLQYGIEVGADSDTNIAGDTYAVQFFKRAKGFFDVVAYTGNGTAGHTVNHSLGVAPEMVWVKGRTNAFDWAVYHTSLGATKYLYLNTTDIPATDASRWNDTEPTDSIITLGNTSRVNGSTITYIAYLFASLDGVSKCGSYTGNGSNQNIACGFSAGARFVLIKRTDSNGDWYIWDSTRGIVAGNDPHLSLNTTAAQVTSNDSIDPQSAGFTVNQLSTTNINESSGEYIFLAIA